MFEYIQHILDLFKSHPVIAAGVIGVSLSMLATQGLKMYIPDEWTERRYRLATQTIGFFTGWFFTHGAWALFDPSSGHFERFYASAGAGFASPAIYAFMSSFVMHKFPWFDERFSGRPKSSDQQNKPVLPPN